MADVDALFRTLKTAPPRAAEIVTLVALDGVSLSELAARFGIDEVQARRLVARSIHALEAPRGPQLSDDGELALADALFAPAAPGSTGRATLDALRAHRAALRERLDQAARAWQESPDRRRDEWVRYVLIALVIALSAYFYVREKHQPPRLEPRPTQPSR